MRNSYLLTILALTLSLPAIPTCWYLKTLTILSYPQHQPNSVEYRLRWVPDAQFSRWPCTLYCLLVLISFTLGPVFLSGIWALHYICARHLFWMILSKSGQIPLFTVFFFIYLIIPYRTKLSGAVSGFTHFIPKG